MFPTLRRTGLASGSLVIQLIPRSRGLERGGRCRLGSLGVVGAGRYGSRDDSDRDVGTIYSSVARLRSNWADCRASHARSRARSRPGINSRLLGEVLRRHLGL
jgi:hypothetical protein